MNFGDLTGNSLQSNYLALEHVEFHHLPRVHACCKIMKGLGGNLQLSLQRVRGLMNHI